jgi:hypothetical protein
MKLIAIQHSGSKLSLYQEVSDSSLLSAALRISVSMSCVSLWLNEKHRELVLLLCAGNRDLHVVESWLVYLSEFSELRLAVAEFALRKASAEADVLVFLQLQVVRKSTQFLKSLSDALCDACGEIVRMGLTKKALKKQAHVLMVKTEVVQVTVDCVFQALGGGVVNCASFLTREALEWRQLHHARQTLLWAVFVRRKDNSCCVEEERLRLGFDFEILNTRPFKSWIADDTFLVPRCLAASLLKNLACHLIPVKSSYRLTSVTLDTFPELSDYRQVVSGSGTSVTRLWWRGGSPNDGIVLERYLLDEESLEIARDSSWFGSLEEMSEAVLSGKGKSAVALHVLGGQRVPVAGASFIRQVFVDQEKSCVVTVDMEMTFFALEGSWQPSQLLACKSVASFPHVLVTVHALGHTSALWKRMYKKVPELHFYHPSFNVVTACVACCYGDESYRFEPCAGVSPLPALKLRQREEKERAGDEQQHLVSSLSQTGRVDPKNFWSAERTLHSWLHACVFLGLSARSLHKASALGSTLLSAAAIALALYAVMRWTVNHFTFFFPR